MHGLSGRFQHLQKQSSPLPFLPASQAAAEHHRAINQDGHLEPGSLSPRKGACAGPGEDSDIASANGRSAAEAVERLQLLEEAQERLEREWPHGVPVKRGLHTLLALPCCMEHSGRLPAVARAAASCAVVRVAPLHEQPRPAAVNSLVMQPLNLDRPFPTPPQRRIAAEMRALGLRLPTPGFGDVSSCGPLQVTFSSRG
jgi:hypothetical protein